MKQNHFDKQTFLKYFDYLFAILLGLGAIILIYTIIDFGIMPKYIYYVFAAIVLIVLIFILLVFLKMPNWAQWVRRIFIVLLTLILAFGSFYIVKFHGKLWEVTTPETTSKVNVSLVVRNDSGYHKLNDLNKSKIGIQVGNDKKNGEFVKRRIDNELKKVTYVPAKDYSSLMKKVMNKDLDGLIITNSFYKLMTKEYPDIMNQTSVLKTWQKEKTNEISNSKKDIRYDTFSIYLTGIDDVGSPDQNTRSDVNMLLLVNPRANHIELVSIPRDAYVPNPALNYGVDKLTHTGNEGPENTVKAFENVLGIDIDYYLKLSFTSVIEIIDTLGMIDVNVPIDFCEQDENRSFANDDLICLKAGKQKLNGKQALALARHRHSYTDRDRTHAQQSIIKGIVNKLVSKSGITKIDAVTSVAEKYILTNMPLSQVTNFISYQLDYLKPWSVSSTSLDNGADAMLGTASMGYDLPLSIYLLSRYDIQNVLDKYSEMQTSMKLKEFSFDLNNLETEKLLIPSKSHMVWYGDDTSKYQGKVEEEPVEETKPPEEVPTTPEKPIDPTLPVDPSKPIDPSVPVDPSKPVDPTVPVDPAKPVDPTAPITPGA
ncbi:MAG: LCP family protein [Erysipelotrichaceae bacterium]